MIPILDLKQQFLSLQPQIEEALREVMLNGHYILGPNVKAFEQEAAGFLGIPHALGLNSGTDALHLALRALDIGPGDEVITTPFTFVATAEVIVLVGATPVFVDVDPETCNLDARLVEAAITERTRAILPVSLYGQPADAEEIDAIAARHGLPVVEDAAQSFGATYRGRASGNLSTIGCTSFFPSKPLGCYGDGGAIFTSDDALAEAMREIRVHGQSRRYHHTRIGVGGRMDTLQCAVVLAKLGRFDAELAARRRVAARYDAAFDEAGIPRAKVLPDRESAHAQYAIFVDERDRVRARLEGEGIPTAVHYPVPLHHQPAYRERCKAGPLPHAEAAAARVLNLPIHPYLEEETQAKVIDAVKRAVRG